MRRVASGTAPSIKDRYDPTNFFRLNANITPGRAHVVHNGQR
jgi:hypothetical protein